MADVHALPGVFRADLEQPAPVVEVLRSALDAGLKDVVVVGRGLDGQVVLWGSQADIDAVIGLLMRGVAWLSDREQQAGAD